MTDLRILKLVKIAKSFFESLLGCPVKVLVVKQEGELNLQVGDIILRPHRDDDKEVLKRLKFRKKLKN